MGVSVEMVGADKSTNRLTGFSYPLGVLPPIIARTVDSKKSTSKIPLN